MYCNIIGIFECPCNVLGSLRASLDFTKYTNPQRGYGSTQLDLQKLLLIDRASSLYHDRLGMEAPEYC